MSEILKEEVLKEEVVLEQQKTTIVDRNFASCLIMQSLIARENSFNSSQVVFNEKKRTSIVQLAVKLADELLITLEKSVK